MNPPPDGFVPYSRPSPYLELIGPVYEAAADPAVIGLHIDAAAVGSWPSPAASSPLTTGSYSPPAASSPPS